MTPQADHADLTISTGDRPAFHVESEGRTLVLTLYGVQANPEISPLLGGAAVLPYVAEAVWSSMKGRRKHQ